MPKPVRQYAPLIITATLMAWCCWSQIRGSEPLLANMDEVQLPQIDRDALNPKMSPVSQRDPFQRSEPERLAVDKESVEPDLADLPEPRFDPRTVLSRFRLDATMVGTEYPIALINGRVYREGELIEMEGLPPDLNFRLRRVQADRAVLEIEEEEYEIIYWQTSTTAEQDSEPPQELPEELTTLRQLESVTEPVELEDSVGELLEFLKATVPNLAAELNSLLNDCLVPPSATNEIEIPSTQHDHLVLP